MSYCLVKLCIWLHVSFNSALCALGWDFLAQGRREQENYSLAFFSPILDLSKIWHGALSQKDLGLKFAEVLILGKAHVYNSPEDIIYPIDWRSVRYWRSFEQVCTGRAVIYLNCWLTSRRSPWTNRLLEHIDCTADWIIFCFKAESDEWIIVVTVLKWVHFFDQLAE